MDTQEALALIRAKLAPHKLSYIEELVICYSLEGKRYREMALKSEYEESYLKDTGSRLWQLLSDSLGHPVTKKRLRNTLMQGLAQSEPPRPTSVSPANASDAAAIPHPDFLPPPESRQSLEYPGSPLLFGSPLYVRRSPIEELAVSELQHPGGLLRIKAPWRMGKTSLINYLLGEFQQLGYATVVVDIRQIDTTHLASLDAFFRWFCWSISQQLNLTCALDKYWFEDAGSKLSCTTYIQEHILTQIDSPLIIAIDTCHGLMEYPTLAENFFAMLRSWYEQAKGYPDWQKLRLILAHVADFGLSVHANQSPFNVGLRVEPTYFTSQQLYSLQESYLLGKMQEEEALALASLAELVGGHPYLIQLAFYWLQSGQWSLVQILDAAIADGGIYREYLHRLWLALQQDDALIQALSQVLKTSEPINLNPKQAYALNDIGLVKLMGYRVKLRCELYRGYFSSVLNLEGR